MRVSQAGVLCAYAGGAQAEKLLPLDDDEIDALFRHDLFRIYPELRQILTTTAVMKWEFGDSYRKPDLSFRPLYEYCASSLKSVHLAGDYLAELGSMEVAAASGFEAAVVVRAQLGRSTR